MTYGTHDPEPAEQPETGEGREIPPPAAIIMKRMGMKPALISPSR